MFFHRVPECHLLVLFFNQETTSKSEDVKLCQMTSIEFPLEQRTERKLVTTEKTFHHKTFIICSKSGL